MPTILEWKQIESRVKATMTSFGLGKPQDAFTHLCLDLILSADSDDIPSLITDGYYDRGIDAVYFDQSFDKCVVHLFNMKYTAKFSKSNDNFPSSELDKIKSFFDDLMSKNCGLERTCNAALFEKVKQIWAIIETSDVSFKIHLCSNATGLTDIPEKDFSSWVNKFRVVEFCQHHCVDISNYITSKGRVVINSSLRMYGDQYIERVDGYLKGLTLTARAIDVIELIKDDVYPNQINRHVFDENIREYLGDNNTVNQKIMESALSRQNFEFWYLNNGITIVCDEFNFVPRFPDAPIKMRNLQIVNGGQTSHALFSASRGGYEKLRDVKILVKIIQTSDREIASRIAEATNSQTPIRSRDIRSNDIIQVKLEKCLLEMGYYYERKRYQHIGKPKEKIIDGLRVGKAMLAYYLKLPDKAKTASNQIYGELYDLIFDEQISPQRVITAHQLLDEIERRRNLAIQSMRSIHAVQFSEHWLTEGAYHVLYQMSLICERDKLNAEDFVSSVKGIDEAVKIVDEFFERQERASAYRVFRSSVTKSELLRFVSGEQLQLPLVKSSD